MKELTTDLVQLTGIPVYNFEKLRKKSCALISHYVYEARREGKDTAIVDIGIGILYIQFVENSITYRFEPCPRLTKGVKNSLKGNETDLTKLIELTLEKRIYETYKELL